MIPVVLKPRFNDRYFRAHVAERFNVPVETVNEFLLGILLTVVEAASGEEMKCEVSFGLDTVVDGETEFDLVLMAIVQFTFPKPSCLRAAGAHHQRRKLAESLFRQAMRLESVGGVDSRFRCLVQWRAVDRENFQPAAMRISR